MTTLNNIKQYQSVNQIVSAVISDISTVNSFHSLIAVIPSLISTIEQNFGELVGADKKTLVVSCVKGLVDKFVPQEEQGIANTFIDTVLPTMIDEIVTVANSKLFKRIRKCC